uniref:RING-type domain-containing protein n=1 Tax=Romanomermis culicivorax TaxID=13658 RepID=A0A915KQV2_ROMCU
MSDWVHCNKCYVLPSNSQKFYLSSCGRVYCLKCVAGTKTRPKDKCLFCANPKCGTIEINSQMKTDAQMFFMDPADVIKKQHKQLLSMVEYQKSQRNDLMNYFKNQQKKVQQMMDFIQREMKKKQDMTKELNALKDSNRQLLSIIQQQNVAKRYKCHLHKAIRVLSTYRFPNPNQAFRAPPTPQTIVSALSSEETPFLNVSRHTPRTVASRSGLDNAPHQGGSMSTPRMLGLDKNAGSGSNPYLNVWPKNQSPMNISPRGVGGNASVSNAIPHIKLPFRMSSASLYQ